MQSLNCPRLFLAQNIFLNKHVILSAAFLSAIDSDKDRHEVESADQSDNVVEKTISFDNESLLPNVSGMLLKDEELQNIKVGLYIAPPHLASAENLDKIFLTPGKISNPF